MINDTAFRLEREGDIAIVTMDVQGEPMNTWTKEAVEGLGMLLDELEGAENTRGLIFLSGKPNNFHAGANLKMLNSMTDRVATSEALDVLHRAFKRLAALGFPSVAAIEGHALGGGLEFALACTARIAKDSRGTKLGLPECTLGIFPGGGGTQRLPRLIGPAAFELILRGTVFPAAKAHEMGVIDRLVPPDGDLRTQAVSFLEEIIADPHLLKRPEFDFSQIDQMAEMARQGVLKFTKGREIPGPMLAIRSIQEGMKVSFEEGLEIEKNNFVDAVLSNEAKGGIHTFFLKTMSDKPKALMSKGFEPRPINTVALLGFGTMGRGIAVDILRNTGMTVVAKDVAEALEPGKSFVKKILDGMAAKNRLKAPVEDLMDRLVVTADYGDDLKDADLVIEAVFEDINVKKQVYGEICDLVSPECVIATNTSSIPMDSMAGFLTHPERFSGLHFFSPVWKMQLVEVVRGEKTSQETVDNLLSFVAAIRKRPIVCRDYPGFVVNAVLFPYLTASLEFLESGNSIEEVDKAFMQFGMPLGPIRLTDEVGVDVCHNVMKGRKIEQDTLKNMVADGRAGLKKSGKGFFLQDGSVDPSVLQLIAVKDEKKMSAEEMQSHVMTQMVTVGKELLDKKIVEDPRMIDIGMIWGTGFPPDKGGPMKWADLTGLSQKLFGKTFYESS